MPQVRVSGRGPVDVGGTQTEGALYMGRGTLAVLLTAWKAGKAPGQLGDRPTSWTSGGGLWGSGGVISRCGGVTSVDLEFIPEITCSKSNFPAEAPPPRLFFDFLHKLHLVLLT